MTTDTRAMIKDLIDELNVNEANVREALQELEREQHGNVRIVLEMILRRADARRAEARRKLGERTLSESSNNVPESGA